MTDLWTPERPIRELPEEISDIFADKARDLYQDLEEHHLTVVLIPAPDPHFEGHCIRCVEDQNPQWYRELYYTHKNWRRNRTESALDRIINYRDLPFMQGPIGCVSYKYHYDTELRRLVYDILISGEYDTTEKYITLSAMPNNVVRHFFGEKYITEEESDPDSFNAIRSEQDPIPF